MRPSLGFILIVSSIILASAPCMGEQRPMVPQPHKPDSSLPSPKLQSKITADQKIDHSQGSHLKTQDENKIPEKVDKGGVSLKSKTEASKQQRLQDGLEKVEGASDKTVAGPNTPTVLGANDKAIVSPYSIIPSPQSVVRVAPLTNVVPLLRLPSHLPSGLQQNETAEAAFVVMMTQDNDQDLQQLMTGVKQQTAAKAELRAQMAATNQLIAQEASAGVGEQPGVAPTGGYSIKALSNGIRHW